MDKRWLGLVLLCIGTCGFSSAAETVKANAVFDKLRALSGDWEGTVAWSGKPASKITAHYYATGNGSAVVEDLSNEMSSVYHLDGEDLRVTHYCAAKNQPRLKATAFGPDNSDITFSFVDATNLSSPSAGHVSGLELRLLEANHITIRFQFTSDGKDNYELVDLRRK